MGFVQQRKKKDNKNTLIYSKRNLESIKRRNAVPKVIPRNIQKNSMGNANSRERNTGQTISLGTDYSPVQCWPPKEGDIGTYKKLSREGVVGDNLTPHHMPSRQYMAQYGETRDDGLCMNVDMPSPGTGGIHRQTATYGSNMTAAEKQAYLKMTPHDALEYDVNDLGTIYLKAGRFEEMAPRIIEFSQRRFAERQDLFGTP